MKKYEVPSLEVIKFDQRDIISASGEQGPDETTKAVPGFDFPHGAIGDGNAC